MKKTTLIIVALVVAICCVFGMVACNNGEHMHDYDSAWTHDSTHHWHECKGEGECDAKQKDKATHVDADENGKCDVCDFAMNGGEEVGKEQYAKVLNAFVNYFEPQQATPQAVAKRRGETSSVLPEEITLNDILTYTLDASTEEGVHTIVLPLTYSYLLARLCDNDNFVVGDKPVQFVATVESMTITFVCDFNYDTTADKLTLDLQVNNVVAPGIDSLLHCEIAYDESADMVGNFLIHCARIGANGLNGSIESYTYLTIRNHEGTLKMCESNYFVADGKMEMDGIDEFAEEFGAYHVGLLDNLMDDFNDRAENKDVLQHNFASEFMQAGQYINDLTNRLINSGGGNTDVESITLDNTTLVLDVDEYIMLNVQFNPSNATDKTVVWQSSNEEVATVENGKVHALQAGETTITATTSNGKSATCTITVNGQVSEGEVSAEQWQRIITMMGVLDIDSNVTLTTYIGNEKYYEYELANGCAKFLANGLSENEAMYIEWDRTTYKPDETEHMCKIYSFYNNNGWKYRNAKISLDVDWDLQLFFLKNLDWDNFEYNVQNAVYNSKEVVNVILTDDVSCEVDNIEVKFEDEKLMEIKAHFVQVGNDQRADMGTMTFMFSNYDSTTVTLPKDASEDGQGGDVKPQPTVVGKTFVCFNITSDALDAEALANLREGSVGKVTLAFNSDVEAVITIPGEQEVIERCEYTLDGNSGTITIVSATMGGVDFTDGIAGVTSPFTFDGEMVAMTVDQNGIAITYLFRV